MNNWTWGEKHAVQIAKCQLPGWFYFRGTGNQSCSKGMRKMEKKKMEWNKEHRVGPSRPEWWIKTDTSSCSLSLRLNVGQTMIRGHNADVTGHRSGFRRWRWGSRSKPFWEKCNNRTVTIRPWWDKHMLFIIDLNAGWKQSGWMELKLLYERSVTAATAFLSRRSSSIVTDE